MKSNFGEFNGLVAGKYEIPSVTEKEFTGEYFVPYILSGLEHKNRKRIKSYPRKSKANLKLYMARSESESKAIHGAPVQEKYAMAVRFNVTVDYLQNRKRFVDDTFRFVLPDKIGYNESS